MFDSKEEVIPRIGRWLYKRRRRGDAISEQGDRRRRRLRAVRFFVRILDQAVNDQCHCLATPLPSFTTPQ